MDVTPIQLSNTFIPSAYSQKCFQIRIDVFKIRELLERPLAPVLLQVVILVQRLDGVLALVEAGEPVDEMGAQEGVDVLDVKEPVAPPVARPRAVVAHDHLEVRQFAIQSLSPII